MIANPTSFLWPLYRDRSPRVAWTLAVLGLVALIAWADFLTGYNISLVVAYLVPIFLATWMIGRAAGVLTAGLAVGMWVIAFASMHPFSHSILFAVEATLQLAVYIVFVIVLDWLKTALSHADERFAAVLEKLDALVYVFQPGDGRILYANQKCRDVLGGAPRSAREIELRFDASFADKPVPAPEDNGVPSIEVQDAVTGRSYWLVTQAVRWVDGRIVQLHVATDISARKQADEAARQQREKAELSQRLVTAGEMASLLAHELNQPLAAVANYNTGCVNRLRSGNWQSREILEALEKSVVQARRAGAIIQRVREFLRKREPALGPCDLAGIISEVAPMVIADAKRNAVSLRLALERGLPAARADSVLIRQVILNLIKNGIESMQNTPVAGRELQVRLAADSRDVLRVDVADHGCGLPAELAADPVKPFFTTKPDGMGMGLQICRSIVEMHGGRLWATPGVEGGTVFHFTVAVDRP